MVFMERTPRHVTSDSIEMTDSEDEYTLHNCSEIGSAIYTIQSGAD